MAIPAHMRRSGAGVRSAAPQQAPVRVEPLPSQPPRRGAGAVVATIAGVVMTVGVAVPLYFALSRGNMGQRVNSQVGKLAEESDVVPSWEAADGLATFRNVTESVQESWGDETRAGKVHFFKVSETGVMDLDTEDASTISMYFYDVSKFEDIVPGETSVPGSRVVVSAAGGYMGIMEGDTSVSGLDDLELVDEMPTCDLSTLWSKAIEAGYPDRGFASIAYPDTPNSLTREGLEFDLSFIRGDGDDLKTLLEDMEWDEKSYDYYRFSIPNFSATDLPRHFYPHTCEPVDVEAEKARLIETLREQLPSS
jgi:hypothetical protein